jgi:hypothetical protein
MAETSGHYRTLGLKEDAPDEVVRAAYRALVKKWHPDRNAETDARMKFERVNRAYRALQQAAEERAEQGERPARPVVVCSRCRTPTAQPRHASFTTITSFVVTARKRKASGIFCHVCARRTAIRASAISGLAGWWSPQGLFLAPMAVLRNARGGDTNEAANLKLVCHNLLAFRAAGDTATARALAHIVTASRRTIGVEVAVAIADLHASDDMDGELQLLESWTHRRRDRIAHALCAAVVPLLVLTIAYAAGA